VPVDERRDHEADQEAAGHIDRERAPREHREAAALDQAVEAIATRGAECASGSNGKNKRHGGSFCP
jgi:hypothetical protein